MKTNIKKKSEVRADRVTNEKIEVIYLGLDLHKKSVSITRILDHTTPQPAQHYSWDRLGQYVGKQLQFAKQVYAVYEAGAFGYMPCRKLHKMGVTCYIMHPEKLDPQHKRVQNDSLDSRRLAERLQRYVEGNKQAMTVVYEPTEAEERARIEARYRRNLVKDKNRLAARGRGLLLSLGFMNEGRWWVDSRWEALTPRLLQAPKMVLEGYRKFILEYEKSIREVDKHLCEAAPKELPVGFGKLTFELLQREICNFDRFKNRRQVASFTGLCGGVSSSGNYHADLSINKAGSAVLRTLLIELAWRMIYYQPEYTGLRVWNRSCKGSTHPRRKKLAVVAVARQLMVDIWRWQTGKMTPEQLGWQMAS